MTKLHVLLMIKTVKQKQKCIHICTVKSEKQIIKLGILERNCSPGGQLLIANS